MLLLIDVDSCFHKLFLEVLGTFSNISSYSIPAIQTEAAFFIAEKKSLKVFYWF